MPVGGRRPGAGRPKGVPNKATREIKEAALQYSEDALKKIVELMGSQDERVALMAAQEILNRAHGKPKQALEATINPHEDWLKKLLDG